MRIATSTLFDTSVRDLDRVRRSLAHTENQLASGRKLTGAADDPVAARQVASLERTTADAALYSANRAAARQRLGVAQTALDAVARVVAEARAAALAATSGSGDAGANAHIAGQLRAGVAYLAELGNTRDGHGEYVFSGERSEAPFAVSGSTVECRAGDVTRSLPVSATQALETGFGGRDVFERIPQGNGRFSAVAATGNTGTGVIGLPESVTDHASGGSYRIAFRAGADGPRYDVFDTATGAAQSADRTFTSGSPIELGDLRVTIEGAPEPGDSFTVAPAGTSSLFDTLAMLADAFEQPASDPAAAARRRNAVSAAAANLAQAGERISLVQTVMAARINEIDALETEARFSGVNTATTLESLRDVDHAQVIAQLSRHRSQLEAAHKAFVKTASLSLLSML